MVVERRKIRVLIVDDSPLIRRLLSEVLISDNAIEVVGTAENGSVALTLCEELAPDIVTLDIEMPVCDGLTAMKYIRKKFPVLPVIMVSTHTKQSANATLEALHLGANDYVTKPAQQGSFEAAKKLFGEQLIPRVKALCFQIVGLVGTGLVADHRPSGYETKKPIFNAKLDIVAIGGSTGGPAALARILSELPRGFSVPIVSLLHMPAVFTERLAARLNEKCALKVVEAYDGILLEPGTVVVAPGDLHIAVIRDGSTIKAHTYNGPKVNSCRPSVDVLFRSVADRVGSRSLGVVLTGMGEDGVSGCRRLRRVGGCVIVQDKESSQVWGMPGFVANEGLANAVLPLRKMSGEIIHMSRFGQ